MAKPKSKKAPKKKNKNKNLKPVYLAAGIFSIIAGISAYFLLHHKASATDNMPPLSYQLMQETQSIIKQKKPPPTTAALYYAYVASVYADTMAKSNQKEALLATNEMLKTIYPEEAASINQSTVQLTDSYQLGSKNSETSLSDSSKNILNTYIIRFKTDGHDLQWDGVIPKGPGKWTKKTPIGPLTPMAGKWQRWMVLRNFNVPPPPVYGSAEDIAQLNKTRQASANRTGEDVNIINYWGGAPGTETPSGIWQNQFYKTIVSELPKNQKKADLQYSANQKILSQVLSDSFMECWKVKYTYWTARPDMRATDIVTAMKDPAFPSYLSGHSTISKAAADVLSRLYPKHTQEWEAWAAEARDSRLKAGIHFDVDNQEGFKLGAAVAAQYISTLNL